MPAYVYGVFAPLGPCHANDAVLFDGSEVAPGDATHVTDEEVGESGDTTMAGTLAHAPVFNQADPLTISDGAKTATWDPDTSAWTGDVADAGSFDADTLAFSVTFDGATIATPLADYWYDDDPTAVPSSGVVVSQPMTVPLRMFGLTYIVQSSVAGKLQIEEYLAVDFDPNDGYEDDKFTKCEPDVSIAAGVNKVYDSTRAFMISRVRFVPTDTTPDPYTLLVHVKCKGS